MLTRIVDRTGHTWAELAWRDRTLGFMIVYGGLVVSGEIVDDPLLGRCHPLGSFRMLSQQPYTGPKTVMTALDWARPTRIPTIAAPGQLPGGTGGVLLDAIARLALQAGVPALRYAGPYPTPGLFRALARSFRCTSSESEFTAGLYDRIAHNSSDELPIDFVPAPCDRVLLRPPMHGFPEPGYVELRDGIERVVLGDIVFDRDGSPARLVDNRAEIWFGDRVYAHVATFAPDGELVDGPHPIPPCPSAVLGREFPAELRAAIAELVAEAVPAPLAHDARRAVSDQPIRWADLGARAARSAEGFEIHAAIWDHIAPLGLARVALAIAEALAPVVTRTLATAAMSA